MEKKTTWLLAEIFNTIPKRSLISEHLGIEYLSKGRRLVSKDGTLSFEAYIAPIHTKRSLIGAKDLRVDDVTYLSTP